MDYKLLDSSHSTAIASFKTLSDFIALSFPLVLSQFCRFLPDIMCYVVLGSQGSREAVTTYGLTCTFFNMLCYSCIVSVAEVAGANCAKAFGAGNYRKMSAFFYKSVVLSLLVFGFYWEATRLAQPILRFINIQEAIVTRTSTLIQFAFWQNLLTGINLLQQTFVVSQNIVSPLYYLNFLNILIILVGSKIFILDYKMQEIGIVWAKIIQESVMFLFLVVLIFTKANKETIMVPSFKAIKNGLNAFLRKNFFSFLGMYGEFLAFEANTILVAHLHNLTDMAAWVTFANIFAIMYSITIGLGNAFRTRISQIIGEGDIKTARLKSIAYFVYVVAFGAAVGVLMYYFSDSIAQLFIDNNEVVPKIGTCLRILSFASISFFGMNSFFVLFRVLNMELYLFKSAAVALPILSVCLSGLLAFPAQLGLAGVVIGQGTSFNLLTIVFTFKVYVFETWENLCKHDHLSETLSIE